ncbi:MAG: hypothetical protein H6Q90_5096 [Deltaproteobacteria bacterium]|nr:hypothetical protein [Deltaproteobacteria bacterium]
MIEAETRTCIFKLDPRGFVHAVMRTGCEMDVEDAVANVGVLHQLGPNKRSRVLVDMRGVRSQTRGARQYFAGPEAAKVSAAVALLIGSPISSVLGNFFMRVGGPLRTPTALFTDASKAISWLLELPE